MQSSLRSSPLFKVAGARSDFRLSPGLGGEVDLQGRYSTTQFTVSVTWQGLMYVIYSCIVCFDCGEFTGGRAAAVNSFDRLVSDCSVLPKLLGVWSSLL
jgi:hypothetical protein